MPDWIVIEKADVAKYIAQQVIDASDDPTVLSLSRLEGEKGIIASVVAKFRGAIVAGGVTSLSGTEGSVPPEAVEHVLVMCIRALAAGMANPLATFVNSEFFKGMLDEATEWLKLAREGMEVQSPDDPDSTGGASLPTVVINPGPRLTRDLVEGF